jgi:uncharacterized membrane protein
MKLELVPLDWITVTAIVIALVSLMVLRRRQKSAVLFWWRAGTMLLLLVLLLQPSSLRLSGDRRPLVAVACDTSPSMFLADRAPAVRSFLQRWSGEFSKNWDTRLYRFARSAVPVNGAADIKLTAASPTDIQRSLWEIKREAGNELAGIVVLSDFNHNASTLPDHWVEEHNVPVFAVVTGARRAVKDIAVESIQASDFAFKNVPLDIVAGITAQGVKGAELTVDLKDAGSGVVLATQRVACTADRQDMKVNLRFTPAQSGQFRYAVEAEPQTGEVTTANNRREFELEVIRDKLRVLYICGQPGPEYAFLRHMLKTDPMVELVSFVILRNPESITLVPENDLSLIAFPVQTIFTRDLYDFDALILENFTHRGFGFLPEYLENIRRWVTVKGGGLVMVAGRNSFGSGGWAGTPVEDVLPVIMDTPQDRYEDGLFTPVIDDDSHFIVTLNDDRRRSGQLWKNAPSLDGCQALKARPGAVVLMHHPLTGAAVLACWEKGKGRVVTVGTNTTWRWALGAATPELYNRFWKNVLRYSTRSAEAKGLHLAFDRADYSAGQGFVLKVRGVDKSAGADLRVFMIDPSGAKLSLQATREGEKEWLCSGEFREAGAYSFEAVLERNGTVLAREPVVRRVTPALYSEETELAVNESLARETASDSGGLYFTQNDFSLPSVSAKLKRQKEKTAPQKAPLWTSPLLFALCCISLAGEWFFRRRSGHR